MGIHINKCISSYATVITDYSILAIISNNLYNRSFPHARHSLGSGDGELATPFLISIFNYTVIILTTHQ